MYKLNGVGRDNRSLEQIVLRNMSSVDRYLGRFASFPFYRHNRSVYLPRAMVTSPSKALCTASHPNFNCAASKSRFLRSSIERNVGLLSTASPKRTSLPSDPACSDSRALSLEGKRPHSISILSGGNVLRPCLKTYLETADANTFF